jgi:hypothetical protein
MELVVMRSAGRLVFICAAVVALTACSSGSAASPLLVSSANPHTSADPSAPDPKCTPFADSSPAPVQSDLTLTGSCHFTDHTAAKCVVRPGDYYVYIHHDLPDDGQYVLTMNVENYNNAGAYKNAQVYLQITRHGLFYYWSTSIGAVTIATGATSASISSATLAAEPGTPARGSVRVSGDIACPGVS